jgi:putative inorganic carbon (HCO3(-)) transporter
MLSTFFVGLFIRKPRQYILTLLILSIQFQASKFIFKGIAHFGGAKGVEIQLSDVGLALLILMWISDLSLHKRKLNLFPYITVPAILFLFAGGMSLVNSSYLHLSLFELIRIGKYFLLYLCVANIMRPKEDLPWCINALAFSILIQGFIAIAQMLHGGPLGLGILGESESRIVVAWDIDVQRTVGTLSGPNAYGMYLGAIIPIAFAMLFIQMKSINKLFYMVALAAGIVGLVLSLCRSQWIILPFVIMLVFMLSQRRMTSKRMPWLAAIVFVIVAVAIVASFSNLVSARLSSNFEAAISRVPLVRAATWAIRAHPIIGMGINTYSLSISKYDPTSDHTVGIGHPPDAARTMNVFHPVHNIFLLYAAEIGLIGLASFLWLITRTYKALFYTIRNGDELSKAVGIGIFGGFTAIFFHSMVDWALIWNSLFTLFWLLIAIVAVLHLNSKERSKVLKG